MIISFLVNIWIWWTDYLGSMNQRCCIILFPIDKSRQGQKVKAYCVLWFYGLHCAHSFSSYFVRALLENRWIWPLYAQQEKGQVEFGIHHDESPYIKRKAEWLWREKQWLDKDTLNAGAYFPVPLIKLGQGKQFREGLRYLLEIWNSITIKETALTKRKEK